MINQSLAFKEPLNKEEFDIYLKGGFSVSGDSDTGTQIRYLKISMEVFKGAARFS